MVEKNLLLIFVKNPVIGKVKTRIAKHLGNKKALEIYNFLLDHSVQITTPVDVVKQVYYSEEIWYNDIWDNRIYSKRSQEGSDLGERMGNAIKNGFNEGFTNIILIGSDIFDLNQHIIENAFLELKNHDYVLGPAEDGGYYLIGMKSLNSEVFKNKNWGTSSVLQETLDDLKEKDLKILETLNDVDVFDDIKDHPAFQKFINL